MCSPLSQNRQPKYARQAAKMANGNNGGRGGGDLVGWSDSCGSIAKLNTCTHRGLADFRSADMGPKQAKRSGIRVVIGALTATLELLS
jgi:hypothetical protein